MRYFFILNIVCFCFTGFSQLVGLESLNIKDSNAIFFNSTYDVHSTSVQNSFNSTIFRGGEITEADKTNILAKHKNLNRVGRELKGELIFSNLTSDFFKLKDYSWMYAVGYNSIFSGNYTKDLVNLALNGNATSLGDTMNFGGSSFQQMTYQTFGVGIQDKKTKSYLSLNVVNLQSHFNGRLDGDFYSSADTASLYLKVDGNLASTYKSKMSNGIGVALNFVLNIQIPLFINRNASFQLKISDFGVVRMNPLAQTKVDTVINFSGFEVSDLLGLQQVSLDKNKWMDTLNVKQDTISSWKMLPLMMQFSKILVSDSLAKYQTFFGVRSYPTLSYFPKIFAGVDYKINAHLFSGLQLSYGGFGGFRAGFYARIERKNMHLFVGSEDIYGLVSKNGFGQQVNLRLICGF